RHGGRLGAAGSREPGAGSREPGAENRSSRVTEPSWRRVNSSRSFDVRLPAPGSQLPPTMRSLRLGALGLLIVITGILLLWVTNAVPRADITDIAVKAIGAVLVLVLASFAWDA